MKINQKKLDRQLGIIDRWLRVFYGQGTCEACTAFGKTYIAILVIKRLLAKYPQASIDVVLPGIDLADDWNNPKTGHIVKHGLRNVSAFVINTYIRYQRKPTLLIIDEIHHLGSDEFSKVFTVSGCKPYREKELGDPFILGLTATLERLDGKHSFIAEYCPIVDTVTLDEAKREGYVSDFKVFNLGLQFNEQDKVKYDEMHSTFNNAFGKFNHNFPLAMACSFAANSVSPVEINGEKVFKTGREWILYHAQQNEWDGEKDSFWSPTSISKYAQQFSFSMRERKRMIYEATVKIDVVKALYQKFRCKTIVFSESSKFADAIAEKLGSICKAYHTKLESETRRVEVFDKKGTVSFKTVKLGKEKLKKEIKESFKNPDGVQVLSTVKALDEGFDYDGIRLAIMASYNSSKRQNTQRTGRGVRIDDNDLDKVAIIINLYIIGTQEEKWLKEKQRGTREIIWIKSIDEIKIDNQSVIQLI